MKTESGKENMTSADGQAQPTTENTGFHLEFENNVSKRDESAREHTKNNGGISKVFNENQERKDAERNSNDGEGDYIVGKELGCNKDIDDTSTEIKIDTTSYRNEDTTKKKVKEEENVENKKIIDKDIGGKLVLESLNTEDTRLDTPPHHRAELIEKYQAALTEQRQLKKKNNQLQNRLAEYLRKKKADGSQKEEEKTGTNQEHRYQRYLANIVEMKQVIASDQECYHHDLEEIQKAREHCLAQVEMELKELCKMKREVARIARNSRTGKPIPHEDLENYLSREQQKEAEVEQVRLEHIKLRNRLQKQEAELRAKEELGEGLHLIDFEQLKIENQTYCDKIQERDEELSKLRKKINSSVQVLAHLKEKLQFVQTENDMKHKELKEIEARVTKNRAALAAAKQKLDALRNENMSLHQKCGLLGHMTLLQDFEQSYDEVEELRKKLCQLQLQYREEQISLNGLRQKIQAGKQIHDTNL